MASAGSNSDWLLAAGMAEPASQNEANFFYVNGRSLVWNKVCGRLALGANHVMSWGEQGKKGTTSPVSPGALRSEAKPARPFCNSDTFLGGGRLNSLASCSSNPDGCSPSTECVCASADDDDYGKNGQAGQRPHTPPDYFLTGPPKTRGKLAPAGAGMA